MTARLDPSRSPSQADPSPALSELLSPEDWLVRETGFDRATANRFETLFTVGNGRLGTRGSLEEGHRGQRSGTFLAGVFDKSDAPVIDLVNAPDWVDCAVYVDGSRLDVDTCTVVDHQRALDMRTGLLWRRTVFEDAAGRRTRLESLRCVSMADRELCALRVEITPEDHASVIEIHTGLNGNRRNLERLPQYPPGTTFPPEDRWEKWAMTRHLRETDRAAGTDWIYLQMQTVQTGHTLGYAAATAVAAGQPDQRVVLERSEQITERLTVAGTPGRTIRIDKLAAICTSRDVTHADEPIAQRCRAALERGRAAGFPALVEASRAAWSALWDASDCEVLGRADYTRAVRFSLYHLLIAANPDDPTVSIGAKSLSGEGYRGHVFWDTEIMMLPFFTLTQPRTAQALLGYRHHTLPGARTNSREHGTGGARYAWESADTGLEECPTHTPDGANRFWAREEEVHVSSDVGYGILRYVEATADPGLLLDAGAEVLFETSRFFVDRATTQAGNGYRLLQVMGPDEFHSHVDDNAFTNHLAAWHLRRAAELHDLLAREHPAALAGLTARIGLSPEEPTRWRAVAAGLRRPMVRDDGVIEQFDGYFAREDVRVTDRDAHGMPKYPPGRDHFTCETTTLLKQPDVLMLMYLLPADFSQTAKHANYEFYEPRTLHKSSLSPSIHAIMGIEVGDPQRAVQYFEHSAFVDLADNQGNTAEGMHIASAGGTWQALVCGFGGLRIVDGRLTFRPWLPPEWDGVRYRVTWRGRRIHVTVTAEHVEIHIQPREHADPGDPETVVVHGEEHAVPAGNPVRIALATPG